MPAVVKLLAELLEEHSKFSWKAEQVGAVWVLAPASFLMLFPPPEGSPERWLRISPVVGESPLGRLRVCILGYDVPQQFLLDIAVVVYALLGLFTEIESGNPAGNHTANAVAGSASDQISEHGAGDKSTGSPQGRMQSRRRRFLPAWAPSVVARHAGQVQLVPPPTATISMLNPGVSVTGRTLRLGLPGRDPHGMD
jgi:hypothetical protein